MDTNNQETTTSQAPQIPESEFKLPEEQMGESSAGKEKSPYAVNPIFVALLLILLAILAVLLIWGEQLIGMLIPTTAVTLPPLPEEVTPAENESVSPYGKSDDEEITSIEAGLDAEAENLGTLDAEMEEIEAEFNAI